MEKILHKYKMIEFENEIQPLTNLPIPTFFLVNMRQKHIIIEVRVSGTI